MKKIGPRGKGARPKFYYVDRLLVFVIDLFIVIYHLSPNPRYSWEFPCMDYFMGWYTFQLCSVWLALPHIYGLRNQKHQGYHHRQLKVLAKGMGFLLRSTAIKDHLRVLELRQYLPLQHQQHQYQPPQLLERQNLSDQSSQQYLPGSMNLEQQLYR